MWIWSVYRFASALRHCLKQSFRKSSTLVIVEKYHLIADVQILCRYALQLQALPSDDLIAGIRRALLC